MELEKRCRNGETWPTSVYCHPLLGRHTCLCSVDHWASGRLLGGPGLLLLLPPLALQTPPLCWGTGGAAGAEHGVVCCSLELAPLDTLPSCTMTLTLSSGRISGMKSDSFTGLSLPGGRLWSVLLLEALLVSVVRAATRSPVEVRG